MFLYLVRHGEARQESEDSERGLTDDGMKSARRMGEFLAFMGTELDTVIHSTKKRARETAQAISESLRPKKEMREENGLA
ncbi:MAG: histidine phosphatase family protein, partial [Syntrophorhabdaceae bacterium]